jgi:hypothetical protein
LHLHSGWAAHIGRVFSRYFLSPSKRKLKPFRIVCCCYYYYYYYYYYHHHHHHHHHHNLLMLTLIFHGTVIHLLLLHRLPYFVFCFLVFLCPSVIGLWAVSLHVYKQELKWTELLLFFLSIYPLHFSILNNKLDLC